MVDCRLSRNNEHYSAYRLLLVIIMAITSGTESVEIDCSEFKNCANCTDKSTCGWSLEKQSCESATFPSVNELSVRNLTQCPRLSVVGKTSMSDWSFKYTVRISNDAVGFKRFLNNSRIQCCFHSCNVLSVDGRMDGDDLVCNKFEFLSRNKLKYMMELTFYPININVGGARLRLDDDLIHYYGIYHCVRNSTTERTTCNDLRIRSFDPAFGPFAGNVSMRIYVRSLWVDWDNRTTVNVAGRRCADPRMIERETIGCTVRWTDGTGPDSGPVEVVYSPRFKLTSEEEFEFAEPVVTAVRPACGPTDAGAQMTVTGNRLDVGRTVRVSVGKNVACNVVSRKSDRITCVFEPGVAATAAGVTVQFDGAVSRDAPSPAFAYVVKPIVDAGQPFASIATGGTTGVPVRGRGFSCVERPTMHVALCGVRHYARCRVKNDSYMVCRSPEIGSLSSETTTLDFGFLVRFAGRVVNVSPEPDPPHDLKFEDFEIDGNVIVINGHDMNRGYLVNDLAVRLLIHSDADCVVTSVSRDWIKCTPTPPLALDNDLSVITVTIGNKPVRTVKKKTTIIFVGFFRYVFVTTNLGIIVALMITFTCVLMIYRTSQIIRLTYV